MSKRKKTSNKNKQALQARSGIAIASALNLRVLAGVALIAVITFFIYFHSLGCGFILDDDIHLTSNQIIKASDGLYRFWCTSEADDYYPVSNTTLWIEWRLWGMKTTGYHVTNLILHIVESLLIWLILRKLSMPGAFLAAMIFAVHPVNVESVAWIAQRKNMMAMLFLLLSILYYLKTEVSFPTRQNSRRQITSLLTPRLSPLWYWLSLVAFLLAMLSKGSVAILPVLLLGIVWWLRPLTRWDLLRIAPFFLVALVLTGVNVLTEMHRTAEAVRIAGFTERLLGAGSMVWFYLYKALFPVDLAFVYPQWRIEAGNPLWWLPLLAAMVMTVVLWLNRQSWSRPFLFAWGFFCVALLPVMGLTDVGFMRYSLVADHYQHIAIIGVIVLVAAGWSVWQRRVREPARLLTSAVALAVAGTLTFLTWQQSGLYSNEITLYQATLEKNPDCWLAHTNLGVYLNDIGRPQEAIIHYEEALRLKSDCFEVHNNLGNILRNSGHVQEAIAHYHQALQLKPDYPEAQYNLGSALVLINQPNEAIEHYQQALKLRSNYPDAHYNLGITLVQTGRLQEAIEHYEQALQLKADFPEAQNSLGIALAQTGKFEEAVKHYRQALRLKPDYTEVYCNLSAALIQIGRPQEAIKYCEQALLLKPDYPEAHNNLGLALIQTNRPKEAIEQYRQALRLKPDFTNVYYNLALAYAGTQQSAEALASAQKGLELARSQGQTALAGQIEDWLNSYRGSLPDRPGNTPFLKSAPALPNK